MNNGKTGAPAGDIGHIFERGDQNNVFLGWDESEDKFRLATTTATGASTGDLAWVATQTILANVEGTLTGNASSATTADGLSGSPNITVGTIGCGAITGTSSISDTNGNLRTVPSVIKNIQHTLTIDDVGRFMNSTSGGFVINSGVFSAGDCFTLYNSSGSDVTITQGSSVTLRLVGKSDTGNRTLAQRGLATVLCVASNEFVVTGGGVT